MPEAADGVARFSFDDLCARPLGAGDYLKIADAFHTIILADVPVLAPARRNEAKRLINLIDTLYDKRVRLIVSAEAEPDDLWQGRDGAESFEFARTASRLIEMRSDAYWDAATAKRGNEKGPGGVARACRVNSSKLLLLRSLLRGLLLRSLLARASSLPSSQLLSSPAVDCFGHNGLP